MKANGVFEGGGVKGISLVGAVRAAELNGVELDRVAGTSSGSIVASLVATGYTAAEMKLIIESAPFASFLRRSKAFALPLVGPALRLLFKKGLYSGDALERWIRNLLRQKGVVTFGDLEKGKLKIVASDITNGRLMVLPDDLSEYGLDPERFEVARAVRMSASIPFFFEPVLLPLRPEGTGERRRRRIAKAVRTVCVVDGGLLSNFPLWLFDREAEENGRPVIGFQMVGRSEAKPRTIGGPLSMLQAMFETMLSAHDERYIERYNAIRTIKIPTLGIGTTDFHLSAEESERLYLSGLAAGERFFEQWDRKTGMLRPAGSRGSPQEERAGGVLIRFSAR
ncbi:patatin-like phospholipase family protein [Cohnella massiliensis]|uniref:patatin-like phospholipase family protein n=1 Tax=Cohnella massiliensis TaxID=1816691 RepID=UPI0009BA0816|nr:patatin-like phospholipase family protein [Cohnella massiliensis]